ncbi:MAG: response regulator [Planctomycetota bacterium]|jgi:two-component system chemotaxis response regulator CheY
MLTRGELSKQRMIQVVVDAEFSEWNSLFLYVINTLKAYSRQFQYGAAAVQAHERRIEEFLERVPEGLRPSRDIRDLPQVWETKFLVVDDEQPLRSLFSRLLSRMGTVDTVDNGADALARTRETFYNVVITDVNMPVMDGLEFYRQAVRDDPSVRSQFVFYTGALTPEAAAFFEANHLPYLIKPFTLDAVTDMIHRILQAFPEPLR